MIKKCKKFNFTLINLLKIKVKYRIFAFFCVVVILIILYIKFLAVPIVVQNTETQIKTFATQAINYAVAETMNNNVSYGDIVTIVRDSNENVSFIEANSVRINILSKQYFPIKSNSYLLYFNQ